MTDAADSPSNNAVWISVLFCVDFHLALGDTGYWVSANGRALPVLIPKADLRSAQQLLLDQKDEPERVLARWAVH